MRKHFFTLTCFVFVSIWGFMSPTYAQSSLSTAAPERPEEFLKKLGEFTTLNQQPRSIESFEAFQKKFKSGGFNEKEAPRIMALCNAMREARLNAIPYFIEYMRVATFSESGGNGAEPTPFEKWHQITEGMLAEFQKTRKFEPMQRFLLFSANFYEKNALFYADNAVNWYIDNKQFKWQIENGVPSLTWEKVRLSAGYKKDSIEIKETKGIFFPVVGQWIGNGAMVTWERFSGNKEIYCALKDYTIDVSKGTYHSDRATLHYPAMFPDRDLEGSFDDRVNLSKGNGEDTYPRFESFDKRLKVTNIGSNINYEGGFRLYGMTVYGYGTADQRAQLTIADPKTGKRAFKSSSELYAIRKGESMHSEIAEAIFYFASDSIFHPSVNLKMDIQKNVLQVSRGERGSQRNPFYNSYHKVNMEMAKIKWLIDKDTVILGDKSAGYGTNTNTATFESFQYFSEPDFRKIQNISEKNPISVLKFYSDQTGKRRINGDAVMRQINPKMDAGMVQGMISDLVAQGFINYSPDKNEIELKDKVFHYSMANAKKVDFDAIKIKSETPEENSYLNLADNIVQLNGVKSVELSNKQKVRIFPSKDKIWMKKNRDLDFDGRINSGMILYYGKKYHFNYDLFDIKMDSIRYMDLYLKTGEDAYKRPIMTAINSRIENTQGTLLIDAPNNKSGREDLKMFPSFQTKDFSYVFYDLPETQDTVYKRDSFFFKLERFNLDGIDSLVRDQLKFKGTMVSNIFPAFNETLTLQKDSSLGFSTRTPPDGYPTYGDKGNFKGEVSVGNKGFLGSGLLSYLDAKINSKDMVFKPNQTVGTAESFFMAENRATNVPQVSSPTTYVNWLPKKDSMYLTVSADTSFKFFPEGEYRMKGVVILTPSGVKGVGKFEWEKGILRSKMFSFGSHSVAADTMQLSIKALNKAFSEQLALDTRNLQGKIDFDAKRGKFKSNSEKDMTNMPGIQYKTTINEFEWDLDGEVIDFQANGRDALFVSSDPEQDSLYFYGKKASYDLKSNVLRVGGVDYVKTCDAFVYPDETNLQVEFGGKMTEFQNARIVCDTLTKHHVINKCKVKIKGRKEYTASGFYEYNVADRQQEIKFDNIIGQRVGPGSRSQKRTETQATGTVTDADEFRIDRKTSFKGTISLFSNTKNLKFEGFAKLELDNLPIKEWFSVNSQADKSDLILRYNLPKNERGVQIRTGFFLSKENNAHYPRIMAPLNFTKDRAVMDVRGAFKYDAKNDLLIMGDSSRVIANNIRGTRLVFDNRTGFMSAEGKFNFGTALQGVSLVAAGQARASINPPTLQADDSSAVSHPISIETMLGIDLKLPDKLMKIMNADVMAGTFDSPDTDNRKDDFVEKTMVEFIPDDKEYQKAVTNMRDKTFEMPEKFNPYSLLFSRVSMRWVQDLQSFVSYGLRGDLGSIYGNRINKKIVAAIEIKMPSNEDDRLYIYIKTGTENHYFFGYQKGILEIHSSNPLMEEQFNKIKPKERVIKIPNAENIEMQWGEAGRAEAFVKRVQAAQTRQ
jgi:hypothetical protein